MIGLHLMSNRREVTMGTLRLLVLGDGDGAGVVLGLYDGDGDGHVGRPSMGPPWLHERAACEDVSFSLSVWLHQDHIIADWGVFLLICSR